MTKYHIVLSIQWMAGTGVIDNVTHEATVTVRDGMTRQEVFRQVRAALEHTVGIDGGSSTVLFFDCQPNNLSGQS